MRVPTPDPGYWPNKVVENEWKKTNIFEPTKSTTNILLMPGNHTAPVTSVIKQKIKNVARKG